MSAANGSSLASRDGMQTRRSRHGEFLIYPCWRGSYVVYLYGTHTTCHTL